MTAKTWQPSCAYTVLLKIAQGCIYCIPVFQAMAAAWRGKKDSKSLLLISYTFFRLCCYSGVALKVVILP